MKKCHLLLQQWLIIFYNEEFIDMELSKFARNNVNELSCEAVTLHLREYIIPKMYKNMKKDRDIENQPTYQELLQSFHLKSISSVTTWRWMRSICFFYCEREKIISQTKTKTKTNQIVRTESSSSNNIFNMKKILTERTR